MKTHALETLLDKAVGIQLATLSNKYDVTMDHPPPPPPARPPVLKVKLSEKTKLCNKKHES